MELFTLFSLKKKVKGRWNKVINYERKDKKARVLLIIILYAKRCTLYALHYSNDQFNW